MKPADVAGVTKQKPRSLYGSIANTLGVPLTLPLVVQDAFAAFVAVNTVELRKKPSSRGLSRKGQKQIASVAALCAALFVSGTLKQCSNGQQHELAVNLRNSNVDGLQLLMHLDKAAGSRLAASPILLDMCQPQKAQVLMSK